MSDGINVTNVSRGQKIISSILFCIICILLNYCGSQLASALNLPLYLDTVGVLLASIVGGYLPGVIVGYASNLINTMIDPSSFYYSVISVLIAVVVGFFAERGWYRSIPRAFLTVPVLALIGGGLSSVLTWNLFGFTDDATSALSIQLLQNTDLSPFAAQLLGDLGIELIDKAIVVALALIVVRLLPKDLADGLDFCFWQQKPLTSRELAQVKKTDSRTLSVSSKIALIVSVIMIAVVVVTTSISYFMFTDSMVHEQATKAEGIVTLAKQAVDPDKVDSFLQKGEAADGFVEAEQALANIRDSFEGVQYIYVYRILEDGCHVVLDPDTEESPGSDPGSVIEFDQAFMPYLDELLAGHEIEPLISDETYGWLLTVYQPLYDASGKCQCYVAVDINMDHIIAESYQFLTRVIALFGAFFILICVVVLWFAEYSVILPLNTISHAMSGFAFDSVADRAETVEQVRSLDIHTGDEVENLYHSVLKTAEDTMGYIAESEEKTATISRMQDNLIMVMADLVESRDKFTGDHVRKTALYALAIMEQMREEGIYADELTPDFVSDVYHSAPLHDIGKIVVSDTVLNKPGRLTAEEFEQMKQHTTAGREIMERAVGAVSEETYLDEAKNLAEFHHEKWDGSGYPTGIAGEDIPLSARIMAVADVFDALVSKRSYKDGFPLAKAYAIIEEGIGTHFDPQIVKAFLDAREEVERIVRSYGDGQTDKEQPAEAGGEQPTGDAKATGEQAAGDAKADGERPADGEQPAGDAQPKDDAPAAR